MPKKQQPSALKKISEKIPDLTTRQKVAAGIGLAAATATGIAAIRAARAKAGSKSKEPLVFHLEPHGETWRLRLEGASDDAEANFETKAEGLEAARSLAREQSPSELVVHRADGSEQTRHRY